MKNEKTDMQKFKNKPFIFDNDFWYYLNRIDKKENMPEWIWKRVKKIAKSMCEIDFSESKSKLRENLLNALHTNYEELKQFSTLNDDIKFHHCPANENVNRLFS